MFGASGARARDEDAPRVAPEERKIGTKPIFTSSKKKAFVGGDQAETIQSSKQNYDFSLMRTSAATDKVSKGPELGEDGEPRQKREFGDKPSGRRFDFDENADDFETVTEKKRVIKPAATGESSFASTKPR